MGKIENQLDKIITLQEGGGVEPVTPSTNSLEKRLDKIIDAMQNGGTSTIDVPPTTNAIESKIDQIIALGPGGGSGDYEEEILEAITIIDRINGEIV